MAAFIIAEAGVNHNGDAELARRLVDAAADAGADAVKFQTFRTEELVRRDTPKARYQVETTGDAGSQWGMLKALELDWPLHFELRDRARERGMEFLSTAFDLPSLEFLVREVRVPRLKIPSGEVSNAPLVLAAARTALPMIISTGMCLLSDVEAALELVAFGRARPADTPASRADLAQCYYSAEGREALRSGITLLHCTSAYPSPPEAANLRAMDSLAQVFGVPVGYSDHTIGTAVSIAAAARGATVIEKHFTMDRDLDGPDHRASLEPDELASMVRDIRSVEAALGDGVKTVSSAEIENRPIARKSLVARKRIEAGDVLTLENIAAKRPEDGLPATEIWSLVGTRARRSYDTDSPIER